MRQKVVLYNPKAVFYTMPLALLAIGSYLDPEKYAVRIVDGRLERDPVKAVLAELKGALCLGITVLTGAPIRDAMRISQAVKERFPDLPVIWGGWHPSLFPTKSLEESSVDITVQGQGEQTFGELVERLAAGEDLSGLAGIAYRDGVHLVQNSPRPLADMNRFPAHNYDLIPVEAYFKLKGVRQLDYISSTGCYYRCAFCADPFVYSRGWESLDPERMGEEIEYLWRKCGFIDLSFQDETFFTYRKRVTAIAEQFLRRNLSFTWTGTLRADQAERLTDDELSLYVRSGLRRVMVGVESGSQDMLNWMDKDITVDEVLNTAKKCVRHGIGAIFPFIVGFPGESDESVQASLDLVKRLRAMSPSFETPIFYYKPYPGSRISLEVSKNGYQMPETLEEWAEFDYVGSSGPWVSADKYRRVERFKFYNRMAWGEQSPHRRPLQIIARWRCRNDNYSFPIEKVIVEKLKPEPRLS